MIRKATKEDAAKIAEIYDRTIEKDVAVCGGVGWRKDVYPTLQDAEKAIEKSQMFVLEDDGEITASAIINKAQVDVYKNCRWQYSAADEEVMVLHTLCVDPKRTGKGYGRAFVAFYEEYAADNHCKYLRMDTNVENVNARRLYTGLGYRETGIVPCEFNGIAGVELVCFEKKL